MLPEISLGPITLQTFGLMFALAFVVSGVVVHRRFVETGRSPDWAWEMTFAALAGGLIGARAYYLAEHWDTLEGGVLSTIFSGSGLTWYGGALGGAIGVLLWALWRRTANLYLADVAAPALAAGYAVGRIGCQLSGDGDYGKVWDGPWAMGYPNGVVPTPPGVTVHPTPIYETLAMLVVAVILWRLRGRFRDGILFAFYLVLAGAERFLVEILRTNDPVAAGLTAAQLESLALIVIGLAWVLVVRQRHGTLASPAGST